MQGVHEKDYIYNWKTIWKLYLCSLASKKWGALEAPWQMTPTQAAFVCCKACDLVAEDAFSVASQHSIGLLDIKWGTFMSPQRRYVTWHLWTLPACSREKFLLFGTYCNFLKTVGRTHLEGSCVYVGKTNWKTRWKLYPCKQEVRSTGSTLADDFYSSSFCLFHVTL